jgi:hypothetical protein
MQCVIGASTGVVELVGQKDSPLHYGMHTETADDPQSLSAGMEMNMLWPTGRHS